MGKAVIANGHARRQTSLEIARILDDVLTYGEKSGRRAIALKDGQHLRRKLAWTIIEGQRNLRQTRITACNDGCCLTKGTVNKRITASLFIDPLPLSPASPLSYTASARIHDSHAHMHKNWRSGQVCHHPTRSESLAPASDALSACHPGFSLDPGKSSQLRLRISPSLPVQYTSVICYAVNLKV
jgi:hypothetical protein